MKYEAVIFDLDGLMVNTEIMAFNLWKTEAAKMGYEIPIELYRRFIGASRNVVDGIIKEMNFSDQLLLNIRDRRNPFFKEFFPEPGSCNKPGLVELCNYLKENGIRIAIASSSYRDYVDMVIGHLGFDLNPDVVVCGNEVKVAKPNPDVFLKAEEMLGLPAEKCLILEDSKNGILAAKAANTEVIYIEDMVPEDDIMRSIYKAKCDTLADVINYLN